ncbi:MAG: MFS transporter [Acidovorax sp.]|jgi:predicted MFS family arabinose efflux permease|nr:MFS transporter [Acidovorax sp.]
MQDRSPSSFSSASAPESPTTPSITGSARSIAWVVAAIQFTNALEYMAVSPLFPWMAGDLGVPVGWAGYAAGAYTIAAIVSGLLAYGLADRVQPKRLLLAALSVLSLGTLAVSMTEHFGSLMLWRTVAGLTGGITMGSASAILLVHTSEKERPALLALTVAAFSAVSIAGTPLVLWLAQAADWRWSFRLIGACCLLCLCTAAWKLPATRPPARAASLGQMLSGLRGGTLRHAGLNALSQFPALLVIPMLAPILMGLAGGSAQLPLWFLLGGVAGLLASRLAGKAVSRFGGPRVFRWGLAALAANLLACASGVMGPLGALASGLFMVCFMASTYTALVAAAATSAAHPSPERRASFSMLQTSLMHLGSSLAFFGTAWLMELTAMQANGTRWLLVLAALLALGLALSGRALLRPTASA